MIMKTGLYIGRFQPFHLGHLSAIKQALGQVDKLIIAIGSSQYDHTDTNPFTAEERKEMIRLALRESNLEDRCELFLLPDIHDNLKWVPYVKKTLPSFEVLFVGNEGLVKELFAKYSPETQIVMVKHEMEVSGTKIRQTLLDDEDWENLIPRGTAQVLSTLNVKERMKKNS